MLDQINYEQILTNLFDAFNDGDLDTVMSFFSEKAVFEPAAGDESCGNTIEGISAIRKAFEQVYETFPDIQWKNTSHRNCGDVYLSEWVFSGSRTDGYVVEANGLDVFTFHGEKIIKKSAYRKDRPLTPPQD